MTTSELAIRAPRSVTPGRSAAEITTDLELQVKQMDLAYQLAGRLCYTALVPKHFRVFNGDNEQERAKAGDGAVAIMAGARWGLGPIEALQNIFVVHGQPSTYARTMGAVVMSHGHEIETVESSASKVVLRGRRKGAEEWQTCTWTIERADQAGYVKANTKYKTEPENMLYARALAEISRRIAPDALLGMPYSSEELRDAEIIDGEVVSSVVREATDPVRLRDALNIPAAEKAAQEERAAVDVDNLINSVAKIDDEAELQKLWVEHRDLLDGDDRARLLQSVTDRLTELRTPATEPEDDAEPADPPAEETAQPEGDIDSEPVDAETVGETDDPEDRAAEHAALFGEDGQ